MANTSPETAALASLTASVQTLVRQMSRTTADMETLRLEEMERLETEQDLTKVLIKNKKLTKDQAKDVIELQKGIAQAEKMVESFSKRMSDSTKTLEERKKAEVELARATSILESKKASLHKKEKEFGVNLSNLNKESKAAGLFFKNFAWAAGSYIVEGMLKQRQIMKDQIAANSGLIEGTDLVTGLMKQQYQAITRGLDPAVLGKMMTANRQMVNAMGGIENTLDAADPTFKRFYGMTMNLEESMRLTVEQMTRFAQLGIKPSMDAMDRYAYDVGKLAAVLGKGPEAAAAFFDEIASDADSIHLLRAARDGEREAILANQRALVMNNLALGMTAEQAKEAAKMLNKMVAAKPLERIKQAARLRALGGAFGIGGTEEAAQALMKSQGNRTGADMEALRNVSVSITNAADQMRGASLASDLFQSSLLDKLDPNEQFGKNSPFSTQLGDVLKQGNQMAGQYTHAADSALVTANRQFEVLTKIADAVIDGTAVAGGILYVADKIADYMGVGKTSKYSTIEGQTMDRATSTSFGDLSGTRDRYIEKYQEQIKNNTMYTPEEAMALKKNLDIDVPVKQIKGGERAMARASVERGIPTTIPTPPETPSTSFTTNQAIPITTEPQQEYQAKTTVMATATTDTAKGVQRQVDILDNSNDLLKKIQEATEKQVEISERQLAAMLLTDQEKGRASKSAFLQGNSFATRYGYIPT